MLHRCERAVKGRQARTGRLQRVVLVERHRHCGRGVPGSRGRCHRDQRICLHRHRDRAGAGGDADYPCPSQICQPTVRARPGRWFDRPPLPRLPEPTPKALHRWPAVLVPGLPQAGLCGRSQGSCRSQSAQGCKDTGEAWSRAGNWMSGAATICAFGLQARWARCGAQKIRAPRPSIAEADRAALSGMMAAADRLASLILRSDP